MIMAIDDKELHVHNRQGFVVQRLQHCHSGARCGPCLCIYDYTCQEFMHKVGACLIRDSQETEQNLSWFTMV